MTWRQEITLAAKSVSPALAAGLLLIFVLAVLGTVLNQMACAEVCSANGDERAPGLVSYSAFRCYCRDERGLYNPAATRRDR